MFKSAPNGREYSPMYSALVFQLQQNTVSAFHNIDIDHFLKPCKQNQLPQSCFAPKMIYSGRLGQYWEISISTCRY